MKIILKKDVATVGHRGDVKEVANGYAQNFLISRGFAEVATPAKIRQAQERAAKRAEEQKAAKASLERALEKLKGTGLTIRATANEKGRLFESINAEAIAAHLRDVIGAETETSAVIIEHPIKELGEYMVHIAVGTEQVPVNVHIESN